MRVAAEWLRDNFFELRFDLIDCLSGRQSGAVADAKDVRVDGERFLAEGGIEDDVGGLTANAWQSLKLFARSGNLAAVVTDQRLGQRD